MYKVKDNYIFLTLLILTVCGALVRVIGLGDYYYSYDEMWHVYVAKQPTLADVFYIDLVEDGHPILPYFIWHYLLQIWNDPWMVRVPSLIAGIVSIPLAYFMGKEIFKNKHGGLFAAFFIAFSKVMIEQSQVVRGYSLMMLFVIIAFWAVFTYARRPEFRYITIYFVSMLLAGLCEFAIAPLIVFSSAYMLYGIWHNSAKRYKHIVIFGLMNLIILSYLLISQKILNDVGYINFEKNTFFQNKSLPIFIFYQFKSFAYGLGFSYFFNYLKMLGGVLIAVFLILICLGFTAIFKNKKWLEIAIISSFFLVTFGLYYGEKLPVNFIRRNIGMVIPTMILVYYGAIYFYNRVNLLNNCKVLKNFAVMLSGISIVFLLSFLVYPNASRFFLNEFSYKNADLETFLAELDKNVGKKDIIITHNVVSYYLWERYGQEDAKAVSADYFILNNYKVPVYTLRTDYRTCGTMCFNIYNFQKMVLKMAVDGKINSDSNQLVWLFSLYSGNETSYILKPIEYDEFAMTPEVLEKADLEPGNRTFITEDMEFKNWLKKVSAKTIIKEDCDNISKGKCALVYVLYGVPAKELIRKMKSVTYHEPFGLLCKKH